MIAAAAPLRGSGSVRESAVGPFAERAGLESGLRTKTVVVGAPQRRVPPIT